MSWRFTAFTPAFNLLLWLMKEYISSEWSFEMIFIKHLFVL
jgi:hypothetical protein